MAADDQPPAASDIRVTADVVFASHGSTDLMCDVYSPPSLEPGQAVPAVLVIHGGAWSTGSKRMMAGYAMQLAQVGTVAVAINYRLAPGSKFPTQLDDVRDALIWISDHAAEYSIDTDRIGIFGYSAGGHLACMIATLQDESTDRLKTTSNWNADDPRWQRLPRVSAVVAGGPPCEFRDLPPNNSGLAYFLGGTRADVPGTYEAASPCAFVSDGDCPIGFIHGERDLIVPIRSSQSLYDAQVAGGVDSEFVVIEKQGHMIAVLHPKTGEALVDYMRRKLGLDAG
ncbi:MAG: alpha/beta hydrolase fold domain-containing protein [Planctomycetaceae bacterium]